MDCQRYGTVNGCHTNREIMFRSTVFTFSHNMQTTRKLPFSRKLFWEFLKIFFQDRNMFFVGGMAVGI